MAKRGFLSALGQRPGLRRCRGLLFQGDDEEGTPPALSWLDGQERGVDGTEMVIMHSW